MKRGRWLVAVSLFIFSQGAHPLYAGKLDLDIYGGTPKLSPAQTTRFQFDADRQPADPRNLRGESLWVRRVTHVGYAALGIAGIAGSIATGGIGPAIGFGIVALIHGIGLLATRDASNQPLRQTRAEGEKS